MSVRELCSQQLLELGDAGGKCAPRDMWESSKYPVEAALVQQLAPQIASRGESREKGESSSVSRKQQNNVPTYTAAQVGTRVKAGPPLSHMVENYKLYRLF